MKDFDAERVSAAQEQKPTTFKAGGETFTVRQFVRPEMLSYFDEWTAADAKTTIEGFDNYIMEMIEPGDLKRWKKVRAVKTAQPGKPPPLSQNDLESIAFWLLGEAAGRPTTPPSRSQRGSGAQAATSAGASS